MSGLASKQFNIAAHYDVMAQLDQDVHDDHELARSETELALRLIGETTPRSVFLPCFGTGRHIAALLAHGVQRIVGVDLSPECVTKALRAHGHDPRVRLEVGDLCTWQSHEEFDASILLGNSFGDITNPDLLDRVTAGMVRSLRPSGRFVMDYIGTGYLPRCEAGTTTTWNATLNGRNVRDARTPVFDPATNVMSIHVKATDAESGTVTWQGRYDKLVLTDDEVVAMFANNEVSLQRLGVATELNRYYANHAGELGMIARSTWWLGTKETLAV